MLTVGSLFAGVGGFDLGLERAGMRTVWMVENDKQCQQVLRHHWPEVEVYGDVREVRDPRPVDLLCGGFPCQDYSVAGKREGLVGDRGALWWEFYRLIADLRPTWVVGENVPGLLSSGGSGGGRDFRAIVGSLVQLGYGVCWAVLDSQYFGVPQRRRRLFLVGHSGGIAKPEVLALAEGLYGDAAPSREAGKNVAGSIGGRAAGEGGHRLDLDNHGAYPLVAAAGFSKYEPRDTATALRAVSYKQSDVDLVMEQDGTGRGTPIVMSETGAGWWGDGMSPLRADPGGMPSHVVAFDTTQARPLTAREGKGPNSDCDSGNIVCSAVPRRLTPTECERLQGFPDDWTAVDGMKDGPRYRMCGNAVTVPVIEWIGRRILEAERSDK